MDNLEMTPRPSGSWKRPALVALVITLPLLGLLGFGLTRNPRLLSSPLLGKPAPRFTLQLFDGGTLDMHTLRGKIQIVNFWAAWCIPCRQEAAMFESVWRRFQNRGVVIIGVNIQDSEEDARDFIRRFNQTFPNGPDVLGRITIEYGVYGVPETFIVDQDGIIVDKRVGLATEEWMVGQIERLLERR